MVTEAGEFSDELDEKARELQSILNLTSKDADVSRPGAADALACACMRCVRVHAVRACACGAGKA
eukprot:309033-Chlamydomonas_euryale.AAC.1